MAGLIILEVIVIIWWRNYYTDNKRSYEILTDLNQHSVFTKVNFDDTFLSHEYEIVDCNHIVEPDKEHRSEQTFAVLSGFDIPNELILSAQKDVHFILVGQYNDVTNVTSFKETASKTLNMTDQSSFHPVFLSDHLDNNFTVITNTISTLFKSVIEEKNLKAVIFLEFESQQIMWPEISDLLPENHIARKNFGYLLAISLGAEYIIDLDATQIITHPKSLGRGSLSQFKTNSKHPIIASLYSNVNNPYVLMGPTTNSDENLDSENALKSIKPRGYPISDLIRKEVPTFHLLEEIQTRLTKQTSTEDCFQFSNDIIQSLVDETPDADAEFQTDFPPLPVTFVPQSSRLSIHPSQFAPFNAHTTIFSRRAFWALLLPGSVGEAVSDIWRGYIAQTFLHCTGSLLAFSAPIVKQPYDKHSNVANGKRFEDGSDKKLSSQTQEFIGFLSTFNCIQSSYEVANLEFAKSLPHCMIVLYSKLVNRGFLDGEKDSVLIHKWNLALKSLHYKFPNFYPNKECLAKSDSLYQPNWKFADNSFCNETFDSSIAPPVRGQCGDNLLTVVHINFGHKEVIPIWLAQWQYVYPNPVFYITYQKNKRNSGSCVIEPTDYFDITCNVKDEQGFLAYESMIHAVTRFPDYRNYLFIHDDAYISQKTLQAVLKDGISAICKCKYVDPTGSTHWSWIPRIEASMHLLASHGDFHENSFYRTATGRFCPELYVNESKITEGNYLFHYTLSDVFIITNTHIETFLKIITKYLEVEMFLEAAVPMTLRCGLNAREFDYITYWDYRRNNINFNKDKICGSDPPQILHPVWKISHGNNMNEKDWWDQLDKFISIRYCDFNK